MKDLEYLLMAVLQDRHLCPYCRKEFLKWNAGGSMAFCEHCKIVFESFQELFEATSIMLSWGEDAWEKWLKAHPDYEANL